MSCELSLFLNICFCLKKSCSVGWSAVLWASLIEIGWSPDNTCYVCDKFWAVTLKLSQEVGFCISRFLMDLHQQKWSGKIHIFNYWNQLYKVKHCHLLTVLYSKLPWLQREMPSMCWKCCLGEALTGIYQKYLLWPKGFQYLGAQICAVMYFRMCVLS